MISVRQVFKGIIGLVWCVALLYPLLSHADMVKEIDHLLAYIDTSDCAFIRNGKRHDSREAGTHIRRKYDHIKNRVSSAEDFIRYAATRSSVSGRPYLVICDNEEMTTAEWLARELDRFRSRNDIPQ